jgi:plastocyanin
MASAHDKAAAELVNAAIVAGRRGQRSYAEQLLTRAELLVGDKPLAAIAPIFRQGGPPRLTTKLKSMPKDSAPQPASVGRSEDDEPAVKKPPASGSLKGTMTLDGKPLSGFSVIMMWPKTGGHTKRIPKQRVIEQRDKQFAPHVMAVPVGSTVSFPNFDTLYHNVFSISRSTPFDLGMYKQGDLREVKFDKAGIVRLGCNIHASMSAYLVVVDAPAYAVAEPGGGFAFRALSPGRWRVQGWSERSAAPIDTEVTIKPGENTVTIDLKGGATQGPSEDKFGASRRQATK